LRRRAIPLWLFEIDDGNFIRAYVYTDPVTGRLADAVVRCY
jgi:hypothetical protein